VKPFAPSACFNWFGLTVRRCDHPEYRAGKVVIGAALISRTDQRPAGGYGAEAAGQVLDFTVAQNIVQAIAADYHAIAVEQRIEIFATETINSWPRLRGRIGRSGWSVAFSAVINPPLIGSATTV